MRRLLLARWLRRLCGEQCGCAPYIELPLGEVLMVRRARVNRMNAASDARFQRRAVGGSFERAKKSISRSLRELRGRLA